MEKIYINTEDIVITNGLHYFSGIGEMEMTSMDDDNITARLFEIDGQTYQVYEDPSDGYRSYGVICKTDVKCQYRFEPQPVMVVNLKIESDEEYVDGDKELMIIRDAINGNEILTIGTDYYDDYYPMAIFNYCPENMEINKNR